MRPMASEDASSHQAARGRDIGPGRLGRSRPERTWTSTWQSGAMDTAVTIVLFGLGLLFILFSLTSAFRTVVLPRAAFDPLTRAVFLGLRALLLAISRLSGRRFSRETVLSVHAPLGLLAMAVAWAVGVIVGFGFLFDATGEQELGRAMAMAGSSFTTLGFASPDPGFHEFLSITAAIIGLGVVALLIAYLPTIYGLFSRREVVVADIAIKCGGPASGHALVGRLVRGDDTSRLDESWMGWEEWLIALGETHVAEPSLNYFRSPRSDRSWLSTLGALLDAAILRNTVVQAPYSARAEMAYMAGVEAIEEIGDFFFITHSIKDGSGAVASRADFDAAIGSLEEAGVPLVEDREAAWMEFSRLRSGFEPQLMGLADKLLPSVPAWPMTTGAEPAQ